LNNYIDKGREWFNDLDNRDQIIFVIGSALSIILLFYFLVYEPVNTKRNELKQQITYNQEDVQWMQQASQKILANGGANTANSSNQSLLAILDSEFRSAGISESVKAIQPEGKSKAKTRVENIAFDNLLTVMAALEKNKNVLVLKTSLKKSPTTGRVSGNITFSKG